MPLTSAVPESRQLLLEERSRNVVAQETRDPLLQILLQKARNSEDRRSTDGKHLYHRILEKSLAVDREERMKVLYTIFHFMVNNSC